MDKMLLMLGNLVEVTYKDVNLDTKKGITKVVGLHEDGVLGEGHSIEVLPLNDEEFNGLTIKYLPINEELLIGLGFIKSKGIWGEFFKHRDLDSFRIFETKSKVNKWCIAEDDNVNPCRVTTRVDFIHEVQNSYTILSKKKMDINHLLKHY